MARPPITAAGQKLRWLQLDAALDYLESLGGGGGGAAAWGTITGTLSSQTDLNSALAGKAASTHTHAQSDVTGLVAALAGKAATSHTHSASDVTDLAATVQAYTLDQFANPVASLDFSQQQALQFVIENRTSDPGAPVSGQCWLRTDL